MVLPKSMRLKGHRCFDLIHKAGSRYHGSSLVLRVIRAKPHLLKSHKQKSDLNSFKCAIAISNKVSKKSVVRNRLRRFLHAHLKLRMSSNTKSPNTWALISLKPKSLSKKPSLLLEECDILLREAGIYS